MISESMFGKYQMVRSNNISCSSNRHKVVISALKYLLRALIYYLHIDINFVVA